VSYTVREREGTEGRSHGASAPSDPRFLLNQPPRKLGGSCYFFLFCAWTLWIEQCRVELQNGLPDLVNWWRLHTYPMKGAAAPLARVRGSCLGCLSRAHARWPC
jgi:hypothetical protein